VRQLFIDAAFLIALLRDDDVHHKRAIALGDELSNTPNVRFVTTALVIAEAMAFVARGRPVLRAAAAKQARDLLGRNDTLVVVVAEEIVSRGIDFYSSRLDKRYSLTDCISMLVCRDLKITEVLTSDTDFEHEGFTILLKDGA
jgi:predicted nucleic acid-binding protein